MNIVKYKKNFNFLNKKYQNAIIFILNIENNIYFILFFIYFTN